VTGVASPIPMLLPSLYRRGRFHSACAVGGGAPAITIPAAPLTGLRVTLYLAWACMGWSPLQGLLNLVGSYQVCYRHTWDTAAAYLDNAGTAACLSGPLCGRAEGHSASHASLLSRCGCAFSHCSHFHIRHYSTA